MAWFQILFILCLQKCCKLHYWCHLKKKFQFCCYHAQSVLMELKTHCKLVLNEKRSIKSRIMKNYRNFQVCFDNYPCHSSRLKGMIIMMKRSRNVYWNKLPLITIQIYLEPCPLTIPQLTIGHDPKGKFFISRVNHPCSIIIICEEKQDMERAQHGYFYM